jgi:archaellum component FlaG (FlaF/FlaG flagellin family)
MSTLAYLCLLIVSLGIAAAVIAVLTDRLVERWQSTDLQDRINRAKWPNKGA